MNTRSSHPQLQREISLTRKSRQFKNTESSIDRRNSTEGTPQISEISKLTKIHFLTEEIDLDPQDTLLENTPILQWKGKIPEIIIIDPKKEELIKELVTQHVNYWELFQKYQKENRQEEMKLMIKQA